MTTDTTDRVYTFILLFFSQHGRPPQIREIMAGAQVNSSSVVVYHLEKLAARGYIRYEAKEGQSTHRHIGLNSEMARRILRK